MNWYKQAQQDVVYINYNEIRALERLGLLPRIPSGYRGFYYLLPISRMTPQQREAWKRYLKKIHDISPQLYVNMKNALESNKDLSIIGLISGAREVREHEEIHRKMDEYKQKRLEMLFRSRDPEEVRLITEWLTRHGYKPHEVPGEYYAYILSNPRLLQSEPFKLTEEEFNELRRLGFPVPERAKRM